MRGACSEPSYFNRELSWLRFNERVRREAERAALPLLERLKFLAIAASNLDEFFMVRVGALRALMKSGGRLRDIAGLTPRQQLEEIRRASEAHYAELYRLWERDLEPALPEAGIRRVRIDELSAEETRQARGCFEEQLFPVLTPIEVDLERRSFRIPGRRLCLIFEVAPAGEAAERRHVLVPIPVGFSRFVELPGSSGFRFLLVEDVVAHFAEAFFPEERVVSHGVFRLTRNADVPVQEDYGLDLAEAMEEVLAARKFSQTVRLEAPRGTPKPLLGLIQKLTEAARGDVYGVGEMLDLSSLMQLANLPGFERWKIQPWEPRPCVALQRADDVFSLLQERDLLLHHPYDSFEPVVRLLEDAADDPDVVAIKQTLYRTARDSRIVSALIRAAEAGKQVTALVELKARFDEARNLERAEELEAAGAQLIHGIRGLKTHAKATLVARREGGRIRRYLHFGTGNYNESTAKLYTDVSYLTCRSDLGLDATAFFNAITGRSQFVGLRKLVPAPTQMKSTLLRLIADEAERARLGETALILAKMNSLQDKEMIDALYEASQAGVVIKLLVRGVCCLRPGVPGLSESVEVRALIDRYLEHSRIFLFHQGGEPAIFISSADWMTRNLDRRVELLVPIEDEPSRERLTEILERQFDDNTQAWRLTPSGEYEPLSPDEQPPFRVQAHFAEQSKRKSKKQSAELTSLLPVVKPAKR